MTLNKVLPVYLKDEGVSTPETKTTRESEYELAQAAAAVDIDTFKRIYWKYHRRVFGICVRMVRIRF